MMRISKIYNINFLTIVALFLIFIKISIALESTNMHTENDSEMLVVLREMRKYSKVSWISRALIVRYRKSFFSYLG